MLTSKTLQDLLDSVNISPLSTHQALEREVKGISTNSHSCQPGDIFIGMPGTRVDGGEFWQSAMEVGAVAAIISPHAAQKFPPNEHDCVIVVEDVITVAAQIAAAFYNYPAQQLKMIGVTGTNGKTTTTHLIEYFLTQCHKPTALIGTLYTRWPGFEQTAVHTTPFAPELQEQLAQAVAANNEYCVMEVRKYSIKWVVVVLPLVPVTPIIFNCWAG